MGELYVRYEADCLLGPTTRMNIRYLTLLLTGFLCVSCQHPQTRTKADAPAHTDDDAVVELSYSDFYRQYLFCTTRGALRATPKWEPEAAFPPLPPKRAVEAAIRSVAYIGVSSWNIEHIALKEAGEGRWMYLVRMTEADIAITGVPFFIEVPVLMDGVAVEASHRQGGVSRSPRKSQ